MAAARTEVAVCFAKINRFFEEQYELKTGRPEDAARGLEDRMQVDRAVFYARMQKGADGIEEEARVFADWCPEHGEELLDIVDYVINQKTSEKEYPNGIRDQDRNGVRPSYFVSHDNAQRAGLKDVEVFSLRLYTTFAYVHINNPLRDDARYERRDPLPLPMMSHCATEAIRKLRSLRARSEQQEMVVWRGMRNVRVTDAFMKHGGTELAFMSTTTDLRVAVRYALSPHSLLFKIVAPNFMSLGAELKWLSAFPGEAEVLFPPLTFLKPTGRTDRVDAVDSNGCSVTFTIVEITPYI